MDLEEKRKIALSAKKLMENGISYQEFCDKIPENVIDDEIIKLIDLIEHQPAKKGFLGGDNKKIHDEHAEEIKKLIDNILK